MRDAFDTHRNSAGSYRWYLPDYTLSGQWPEMRRLYQRGDSWRDIAHQLGRSKSWTHAFFRRHFGKVCHSDFKGLELVPIHTGFRVKERSAQLERAWECFRAGGTPDDVITLWQENGVKLKRRALLDFLNRWLELVAEQVWGLPSEKLLEYRKNGFPAGLELQRLKDQIWDKFDSSAQRPESSKKRLSPKPTPTRKLDRAKPQEEPKTENEVPVRRVGRRIILSPEERKRRLAEARKAIAEDPLRKRYSGEKPKF